LLPITLFLLYTTAEWLFGNERHYAAYPTEYPLSMALFVFSVLAPLIFGIPLTFRRDLLMGMASSTVSAFGVLYIAASLSLLVLLRASSLERILTIFVLFSVWAGDVAAYYVGKNFGRHKLAPVVSPNKSWEGAVASVIASVAISALVFYFHPQISKLFREGYRETYWLFPFSSSMNPQLRPSWIHVLGLGIVTNVAAQFGDLFESALKRGANVKDSGTLLPGHGGVLDRIDALLFAIPAVWYYAQLTGFLRSPYWVFPYWQIHK
jgi:phosphatidate cytidylyltransferase